MSLCPVPVARVSYACVVLVVRSSGRPARGLLYIARSWPREHGRKVGLNRAFSESDGGSRDMTGLAYGFNAIGCRGERITDKQKPGTVTWPCKM